MRNTLVASTALAALVFGTAPLVPAQAQMAPTQMAPTQAQPAVPAADVNHTQTMERLLQSAQSLRESIQAMAQRPAGEQRSMAMAQAREALISTQQAMVQLPLDMRTTQNYRDAEQRVSEAGRALGGQQPDMQRAQDATDAFLVLVPRLRADMVARATVAPVGRGLATTPLASVSNLPGTDLLGPTGDKVGEIENLLIDRDGNVRAVVVEWGGFLGIGENQTLVQMEQIQLGAGMNDRARISLTREQIEALPRYDRDRLGDYGRQHGWGDGLRWYR
jgi:hypothetical protein